MLPSVFHFSIENLDNHLRVAQGLQRDPIQEAIQHNLEASCSIYVSHGGHEWTGSGYHIGHGLIVTANHVAPEVLNYQDGDLEVTFDGDNRLRAQFVHASEEADASILWCHDAQEYGSVELGDSSRVEIGEIIAVIANPEGWHDTATVGRVSNIHQDLGEAAPTPAWHDVIFVDADILQGASGGMVFNANGDVIGHVMGVAGTMATHGIGEHAVSPINRVKSVVVKAAKILSP
jgi:S1-C subfamily serine protease